MDERVLAQGPGRIALGAQGEVAFLSITDGITVHFLLEAAVLTSALQDSIPVQVSHDGSYCRIERVESRIRLDFALAGNGRGTCSLPTSEFADALAWVLTRASE